MARENTPGAAAAWRPARPAKLQEPHRTELSACLDSRHVDRVAWATLPRVAGTSAWARASIRAWEGVDVAARVGRWGGIFRVVWYVLRVAGAAEHAWARLTGSGEAGQRDPDDGMWRRRKRR